MVMRNRFGTSRILWTVLCAAKWPKVKGALLKLSTPEFLDELHHLLWTEPHENRGQWDEGWSCRNHALIAGAVVSVVHGRCAIVYGEATFVHGPVGDCPPIGMSVKPHAWLGVDGAGYFDLSLNIARHADPGWRPWPLACIAM